MQLEARAFATPTIYESQVAYVEIDPYGHCTVSYRSMLFQSFSVELPTAQPAPPRSAGVIYGPQVTWVTR